MVASSLKNLHIDVVSVPIKKLFMFTWWAHGVNVLKMTIRSVRTPFALPVNMNSMP